MRPAMPDPSPRPPHQAPLRLAVWADADAGLLLEQIRGHEGIEVTAIGGVDRVRTRDRAADLGVAEASDPREALASDSVDALLLLAPDALDGPTLRSTLEIGKPVLAERPMPARVEEWADFEDSPNRPVPVPRISASRHWLAGAEWIEAIGPVEAMQLSLRCHPSEGSLVGRLADGLDLMLSQMGMPAQIAAFGPSLGEAPEAHRGESRTPVAMTAGFADGRWVAISVAIGPHPWHRGVELLGPEGAVRWNDRTVEWIGPDGLEQGGDTGLPGGEARDAVTSRPGGVIGEFLHRWWVRQDGSSDPPLPHRELLACLEAARLSARTGCVEDPGGLMSLL
jgi:predicted dehydrogenase